MGFLKRIKDARQKKKHEKALARRKKVGAVMTTPIPVFDNVKSHESALPESAPSQVEDPSRAASPPGVTSMVSCPSVTSTVVASTVAGSTVAESTLAASTVAGASGSAISPAFMASGTDTTLEGAETTECGGTMSMNETAQSTLMSVLSDDTIKSVEIISPPRRITKVSPTVAESTAMASPGRNGLLCGCI